MRKILAFASIAEFGTGVALIAAPAMVARSLLGVEIAGIAFALARFFGIGLLALAFACWPASASGVNLAPAFRGILVYNAFVAIYLVYLDVVNHIAGPLLLPAAVLHAVIAALLVWSSRAGQGRT